MKPVYLILALAFAVAAFAFVFSMRGDPFAVLPYTHDGDDDDEAIGDAVPEAAAEVGDALPPPDRYQPAERPPDDWSMVDDPDSRPPISPNEKDHSYSGGKLGRR